MSKVLSFIILFVILERRLFAAEAGMPQLDPKYWASQAFWLILVFSILYISIAKFYLPKIKKNLDERENKIKEDLDEANKLKNLSEKKIKEYEIILENSKKEVTKILLESKNILNKDIKNKKDSMEKEILEMKKNSISSISNISQEIASNIIEKISGDKLNESSTRAVIEDISKKNIGKYL